MIKIDCDVLYEMHTNSIKKLQGDKHKGMAQHRVG